MRASDTDLMAALDLGVDGDAPTVGELQALLANAGGRYEESGRHFVLLSLAEAATIRCIMHLKQGEALIEGADVGMARGDALLPPYAR